MGFKFSTGNFLNSTNNRLESLNGKLKQVISKFSSLEHFIEQFFIILPVLRNERSYKAVVSYQKVRVVAHALNSPQAAYTTLLTSYASSFVLHQIELSENGTYEFHQHAGNNTTYYVQTSEGRMEVSFLKCSCCFFSSMRLPCRHLFQLRANSGVSLYDRNLCDERWTNDYYRSKHKYLKDKSTDSDIITANDQTVDMSSLSRTNKMNSHQKYVTAMNVCKKIANTLSQSSQEDFDRKLGQLSSLNELWCNGREVGFQTFDDLANIDEAIEPIQSVRESPAYETVQSVIPDEPQSLSNTEVLNTDDKDASIDYVVKEVMKSLIENIDPIDSIDMEIERDDFQSLTISKIKSIKVPPTLKRKGRPKGSEKTNAIGLPKMPKSKKKKMSNVFRIKKLGKRENYPLTLYW